MRALAAILALLFFVRDAWAVNITFCIDHHVDMYDATNPDDDFFTSNAATYLSRGVWVEVAENPGGLPVGGYTNIGGPNAGCLPPMSLDPNETYNILVRSLVEGHGNALTFYDDDTTPDTYEFLAAAAYDPPATPETKRYALPDTKAWTAVALASWANFRNPVGVTTGVTFYLADACTGGGATLCCSGAGDVYLNLPSIGYVRKSTTIHEMGHCMVKAAGGDSPADYSLDDDPCDWLSTGAHRMTSKEWQGGAMWEGFAHFYWAVAFNDRAEDDCEIQHYICIDWNADEDVSDAGECSPYVLSCEEGTNVADEFDYLGDWCGADDNTGTTLDWLRFFWDLTTNAYVYDVTPEDIVDIIVAADPATWTTSGNGSGSGYPAYELANAAGPFYFDWVSWATDNGVTE